MTQYRFNATKPGKATSTFEYRYRISAFYIQVDSTIIQNFTSADCRSGVPGPGDTVHRIHVHITMTKSLTTPIPLIITTMPVPPIITTTPAPIPLPLNPIEKHFSSSIESVAYEVLPPQIHCGSVRTNDDSCFSQLSVGQVVNLYLAICEGCQSDAWSLLFRLEEDPSVLMVRLPSVHTLSQTIAAI